MGGAPPSAEVTPTERMASGSQSTLFSAVLDAFENLAGEQPLVVGVEDLHWADQSTLAMLTYLAGNLRGVPALFVATLRTDELHHPNPLRPQLAELGRMPTVARMELAPFDRSSVDPVNLPAPSCVSPGCRAARTFGPDRREASHVRSRDSG